VPASVAHDQREQDLVRATRKLFDERGMQDAPVEQIAKQVGIARGLIYRQFSSKEELYVLTVTDYLAELAAAMQYSIQGINCDDPARKDLLMDIGTEELSHLEVVGSIITMLNKGLKAQLAEGQMNEAELYRMVGASGTTTKESILLQEERKIPDERHQKKKLRETCTILN